MVREDYIYGSGSSRPRKLDHEDLKVAGEGYSVPKSVASRQQIA
jgi:hypothetical protein